jgi:hypothetical protein
MGSASWVKTLVSTQMNQVRFIMHERHSKLQQPRLRQLLCPGLTLPKQRLATMHSSKILLPRIGTLEERLHKTKAKVSENARATSFT